MAACTKPRAVVKGPAPTPRTEGSSGGNGRSRPTCSGSPSAGSSTERTATTASCSNPPLQAVGMRLEHLTIAEQNEVVRRLTECGKSIRDIADQLATTKRTVSRRRLATHAA